jgi:hypothetical protein
MGNTLGTRWKLIENLKGTKEKPKKNPPPLAPSPPQTQNLKEKSSRNFESMLSLPIRSMKFLFPKLLVTIFGLG